MYRMDGGVFRRLKLFNPIGFLECYSTSLLYFRRLNFSLLLWLGTGATCKYDAYLIPD